MAKRGGSGGSACTPITPLLIRVLMPKVAGDTTLIVVMGRRAAAGEADRCPNEQRLVAETQGAIALCNLLGWVQVLMSKVACDSIAEDTTSKVHVVSRSIPPLWGSIRFRLALHTYDAPPWGARVVLDRLTKPREIPTRKTLCGPSARVVPDRPTKPRERPTRKT